MTVRVNEKVGAGGTANEILLVSADRHPPVVRDQF
jgi:hypothetical protein